MSFISKEEREKLSRKVQKGYGFKKTVILVTLISAITFTVLIALSMLFSQIRGTEG